MVFVIIEGPAVAPSATCMIATAISPIHMQKHGALVLEHLNLFTALQIL